MNLLKDLNLNTMLSSRDTFYESVFKRPESFSALLPYQEHNEQNGIHILRDGSLGAIFKIGLVEHEPKSPESIVELVRSLKSWFSFSERYTLQVLFDQSCIPARDQIWRDYEKSYPEGHPMSQRLFSDRLTKMRESCESASLRTPMKREGLISIRYFPESTNNSDFLNLISKSERVLYGEMKEISKHIIEFSQVLEQFKISSSSVTLDKFSGKDLTEYLRRFFNPKEYFKRDFAPFNSSIPISDQVIFCGPSGDPTGITREGIRSRTITLKMSPKRVYPGGMANFLLLNFPYKISLNFSFPPAAKIKGNFDIKEFFLRNSPSARSRRQLDELRQVQTRLAQDEKCIYMTFSIIVEGETEEILDQRSRAITAIFHNDLECEVIYENDIGFGLCLNSLPLFHSPAADHSSQRYIPILNKDAVHLLPIFNSFKGHPKGGLQLFLSRENNIVPFTILGNETSNHSCILGDTGSGKTQLALEIVRSVKRLSPEPIIFIVDKKESCKKLCKEYGGELNIFDPDGDFPFTPFRGEFNESKVDFLTKLILTAAKLTSENFEIESFHLSATSRAIKEAYIRRAKEVGVTFKDEKLVITGSDEEVSISMDDVIASLSGLPSMEEFETMKEAIENLISRLMPFYGDGPYAKYFRAAGKTKKSSKKTLLYAYDLDAFDKNETLKVLISMSVLHEIESIKKRSDNLNRMAIAYFEEVGRFGKNNKIVSDYIEEAAETMRKLKVWLIGVAPSPKAFFQTDAGRALWAAADNYLFMAMTPDSVKFMSENSDLFDPTTCEMVRSLQTKAEEYSECLYMNKNKSVQGVFRFWKV